MSGISRQAHEQIARLVRDGMSIHDCHALRRCAMTLQRWFELECGDSNDYRSVALVRGHRLNGSFEHDDDGKPYLETYAHHSADPRAVYTPIPDREAGARKRIAKIIARYPAWQVYVQTDPRGAALYVLRPGDILEHQEVSCSYTNGVALFK